MSSEEEAKLPPHVLIFPMPIQGHLNPMLNLAQLFCLSEFHVTFIVSDFIHRRLLNHTTVPETFARYPGFQFRALSDGLSDDHPRAGEKAMDIIPSVADVMGPLFKKMMIHEDLFASASRRRVTCIVADGLLGFAGDFAEKNGIPFVYFRTSGACSFWTYYCITELLEAHEIPFGGNGMDQLIKSVPGMEGFLRGRDLPSFCRVNNPNDPVLHNLKDLTRQTVRAHATILNTFEDLEGPITSQIRKHIPRLYTIGPLHTHLKSRLNEEMILSSSFWAEDRNCIDWLNGQPSKSVIYVSFGSLTVVTREQLFEFWHGLVNSGQRFLWAIRPDSIIGGENHNIPVELTEGTKERGYLVGWAPQEEVLNHQAVGGFLTHSGWNSTLESILAGVPMICWPYFADQMVNSRFVSEVWKIGLDMKDTCDTLTIENAIREVMGVRKNEFLERTEHMAKLARMAIREGGSSYCNLDDLIEFIKSLVI
ncbi:hypothetical protein BUALT_Bualt01G0044000 [Buddleja alternifolia]|uniref:Glycosyltransferase n=1 Tax=Buddleja alternifolia TaxID=168488 RepID=A0AAV6Y5E1_9LAMI|nr:hypothetical protein BUALT_Bualt01G0044000 [Buddleja alternifolia]